MALLYAASKKKPKEDAEGNKILRLPIFYPILGSISMIGGLLVLMYGLLNYESDEFIFVFLIFLMLCGLGVPLLLMGTIYKITLTPDHLEQTSMLGKKKLITWPEIMTASYGNISMELKIKSHDKKITAHMHLVGFPYLIRQIESYTQLKRKDMGLPN